MKILGDRRLIPHGNHLILFAILFVALLLRVYDLGDESLWVDEGISIKIAHLTPSQIVEDRASNSHPPLYFLLLHYWVNLFGDSEFSTRFFSVIFGILAIPVIYKVGGLIFDKRVAVFSALLLGLSVFHIYYSQEVRGYSLIAFLTLFSMNFFIELFRKKSSVVAIGYVLSTILLLYVHVFGIFVIVAQNIYLVILFLTSKKIYALNFKGWVLLQIALVILFIPWIGVLINQISRIQNGYWIPEPSIKSIISTFGEYSSGHLLLGIFLILSLLSIITYEKISGSLEWKNFFKSIESYKWKIRLSNVNEIFFLLVWLSIPVILPYLISRFFTPIYITRVTISASMALYLLVAKGIRNINYRYVELIVIGVVIVLSLSSVWRYYIKVNKEQWRDVANHIDTNAEYGDLLLFNAGFIQVDVFDYYSKRTDLIKEPFPEETKDIFYFLTTSKDDIKELWPTVEDYDRVWVILSHSRDRKGLITEALGKAYNLSNEKRYVDIKVYLFEKSK